MVSRPAVRLVRSKSARASICLLSVRGLPERYQAFVHREIHGTNMMRMAFVVVSVDQKTGFLGTRNVARESIGHLAIES